MLKDRRQQFFSEAIKDEFSTLEVFGDSKLVLGSQKFAIWLNSKTPPYLDVSGSVSESVAAVWDRGEGYMPAYVVISPGKNNREVAPFIMRYLDERNLNPLPCWCSAGVGGIHFRWESVARGKD